MPLVSFRCDAAGDLPWRRFAYKAKDMMNTVWAVVRDGKIELLERTDLPEGTRVLVTLVPDDDRQFWLGASQSALDAVWDNNEDNIYAELLKR